MSFVFEKDIRRGVDYETHFDPKAFLVYFKEVEGPLFVKFVVESLHKIFSSGKIRGHRLLEIGTGPCLHMAISAARWVDEIILTDFSSANRDIHEKWMAGHPDAHDWEPFFRYYSKLDGKENEHQVLELELREKIKLILHCDVHLPNPLHPVQLDHVDIICTGYCLESASLDIEAYQNAMKNVISLLKPGGKFILMGILHSSFYLLNGEIFQDVSLSKQHVMEAVKISGLEVLDFFYDSSSPQVPTFSYNGSFVILAEKKHKIYK